MTQQFEEAWAAASRLTEEQQNAFAAILQQLAPDRSANEAFTKFADLSGQLLLSEQPGTKGVNFKPLPMHQTFFIPEAETTDFSLPVDFDRKLVYLILSFILSLFSGPELQALQSYLNTLILQQQASEQPSTEVADSQTQQDKMELPQGEVCEEKAQESESGENLTLEEIYSRYPDEWLLIAYTELDENLNVIRGKVIAHSPDRDLLYNQLSSTKDISVAIEYTGPIPENLAIIL